MLMLEVMNGGQNCKGCILPVPTSVLTEFPQAVGRVGPARLKSARPPRLQPSSMIRDMYSTSPALQISQARQDTQIADAYARHAEMLLQSRGCRRHPPVSGAGNDCGCVAADDTRGGEHQRISPLKAR